MVAYILVVHVSMGMILHGVRREPSGVRHAGRKYVIEGSNHTTPKPAGRNHYGGTGAQGSAEERASQKGSGPERARAPRRRSAKGSPEAFSRRNRDAGIYGSFQYTAFVPFHSRKWFWHSVCLKFR